MEREEKMPLLGKVTLFVMVVSLIIGVAWHLLSPGDVTTKRSEAVRNESTPSVGRVGYLRDPDNETGNVLAVRSRQAWNAMTDAILKHDREGFQLLLIQYGVFLPKGLHVRVIGHNAWDESVQIRVIDEESSYYGQTFWTFDNCVH